MMINVRTEKGVLRLFCFT